MEAAEKKQIYKKVGEIDSVIIELDVIKGMIEDGLQPYPELLERTINKLKTVNEEIYNTI